MWFSVLVVLGVQLLTKEHVDDPKRWSSFNERFNAWKELHGKVYSSSTEEATRFTHFSVMAAHVDRQNQRFEAGEITYHLTLNRFSDMSSEEFAMRRGLKKPPRRASMPVLFEPDGNRGPSWDWRKHDPNPVTYVKDQGQCGSCWAFSVVGAVEAAAALANPNFTGWDDEEIPGFSEQQLVDCAPLPNEGCNGGFMDVALDWVHSHGNHSGSSSAVDGLNSETEYPYRALTGHCDWQKNAVSVLSLEGRNAVAVSSPAMIAAISTTPVSIGIDASSPDFQTYDFGTFGECRHNEESIDHGGALLALVLRIEDSKRTPMTCLLSVCVCHPIECCAFMPRSVSCRL